MVCKPWAQLAEVAHTKIDKTANARKKGTNRVRVTREGVEHTLSFLLTTDSFVSPVGGFT